MAAAAAAASALTTLIVLTVHSVLFARIGTLPVALGLWALFAIGAWLVLRLPGRWAVALIVIGGIAMQLAAPSIAAAGGDSIAFVGSISGLRAVPDESVYGMLKAALHHLIATMGNELALAGVRVNGVAPGWTKTPRLTGMLGPGKWRAIGAQIPRGSAAEPWEIAAPLLFLMSQMSSYVTGHVLVADGGLTNSVPHPDVFS